MEFIYGDDEFIIGEAVSKFRKQYAKQHPSNSQRSIHASEVGVGDLCSALGVQDLFSPESLNLVYTPISSYLSADQKKLISYLELQGEALGDTLFVESGKIRKGSVLFTYLQKNAKTTECKRPIASGLESWITKRFKEGRVEITAEASRALAINYDAHDAAMRFIASETDKILAHAAYTGESVVDLAIIKSLTHYEYQGDVFGAIESLTSGDIKRALALYKRQIAAGESPHQTFAMYVYQIRNLLMIASAIDSGMTSHLDIARSLKIHPFVVQKGMQTTRRIPIGRIKQAHHELCDIDRKVKTGRADVDQALERFIVSFHTRR